MAYLIRAWERREEVILALDEQIVERNAWVEKEGRAAAAVQTRFRCASSRAKFRKQHDKASMLQRIYRGYEGRCRAAASLKERQASKQRLLFDYFAEVVQRTFRGYFSRKTKHDFHARKKYIDDMVRKSEEQQEQLNQFAQEAAAEKARLRKEARDRKMKETTTGLHYLLSTKAQRGVFNQAPSIDGIPAEKMISNNVKDYLRTHKLDVRKPTPVKKVRASLQASSPFDIADERMRQEKKWSKLRRMGKTDFVAGTKPPVAKYTRGIADGSEYIDPRKLNASTKEIYAKQKHKFMSKKPFFMAVKSGRRFDE